MLKTRKPFFQLPRSSREPTAAYSSDIFINQPNKQAKKNQRMSPKRHLPNICGMNHNLFLSTPNNQIASQPASQPTNQSRINSTPSPPFPCPSPQHQRQ